MSLDITLVNPNLLKPAVGPIGLDYLADALIAHNHRVRLLDLCFADSYAAAIDAELSRANPDLIGLSIRNTDDCYCASQESFIPVYREIYRNLRAGTTAPIVLGGVGFSVMPEGVLRRIGAEVGIVGDGEWALVDLAAHLQNGADWRDTPGLVYLAEGVVHHNPPRPRPLDELPPRLRRTVDNTRYQNEGGQGNLETKRGCGQRCIYCADPVAKGRTARLRSPEAVADEVEVLLAQGVDCLHLCDSEFNLPIDHARAVCDELIRRHLGERVRWYSYCSPAPFDAELARPMRRAGCVGVNFGVDSGSAAQLLRLGRSFGPAEICETARLCRDQGLIFMYDLLLGGPGETLGTVGETIDLMKAVGPDQVGVSLGVRVYPQTALAAKVRREGFDPTNPNLHGQTADNDDFVDPVFYLTAELGPEPVDYVRSRVAGDQRFLIGAKKGELEANYNYNDNSELVEAIRRGYRGAYWDILRLLRSG